MKTIEQLREDIERTDAKIIETLVERCELSKQIGRLKLDEGMDIIDRSQEKKLFKLYEALCEKHKLQQFFVKQVFKIIIAHSRRVQKT